MSNIHALPLHRVTAGVQIDEDLVLALAFWDPAGAPLDLTDISFTAYMLGPVDASLVGVKFGLSMNLVGFVAKSVDKAFMPPGEYALSVRATDGGYTRDIFGYSTLQVGSPQTVSLTQLPYFSGAASSTMTVIPPSLVLSTPQQMVAAIATLGPSDLAAVAQALIPAFATLTKTQLNGMAAPLLQALPNANTGSAVPTVAGTPYVDESSFVVLLV